MAEEISYWDDVCAIELFIKNNYPREIIITSTQEKDKVFNETSSSKYWASRQALLKCSENLLKDPYDILDEMENDYQVESIFSKQEINKRHYNIASETVKEIKEFLEKRRN